MPTVTVYFSQGILDKINEIAESENESFSRVVNRPWLDGVFDTKGIKSERLDRIEQKLDKIMSMAQEDLGVPPEVGFDPETGKRQDISAKEDFQANHEEIMEKGNKLVDTLKQKVIKERKETGIQDDEKILAEAQAKLEKIKAKKTFFNPVPKGGKK